MHEASYSIGFAVIKGRISRATSALTASNSDALILFCRLIITGTKDFLQVWPAPLNSSAALVVIIGLSDSLETLRRSSHFNPGSWRLRSGGTHYLISGPTECAGMAGFFSSSKQLLGV